jgi:hypothetical protein
MRLQLEELIIEVMSVLAKDENELHEFFIASEGKYIFEYPDDDLPCWDKDWIASRAFILSALRVLHFYHAFGTEWVEEIRNIQVVIEYMLEANESEYFWYPNKGVPYFDRHQDEIWPCSGPLDHVWRLLRYLAKNALLKKQIEVKNHKTLVPLVTAVGLKVSERQMK